MAQARSSYRANHPPPEVSSEKVMSAFSESLSQLEVLVVDCQATIAAPKRALDESRLAAALWWM
jgi:hypothetical protein